MNCNTALGSLVPLAFVLSDKSTTNSDKSATNQIIEDTTVYSTLMCRQNRNFAFKVFKSYSDYFGRNANVVCLMEENIVSIVDILVSVAILPSKGIKLFKFNGKFIASIVTIRLLEKRMYNRMLASYSAIILLHLLLQEIYSILIRAVLIIESVG